MSYPQLAASVAPGTYGPSGQIFIGDAPIVTDSAPALAAITQWQVCVLTATGVTPLTDTLAADATASPDKIVVSQIAVANGAQCPIYTHAKLNHNLMGWPAALDTYAKRKHFVAGSGIQIGHPKPPSA